MDDLYTQLVHIYEGESDAQIVSPKQYEVKEEKTVFESLCQKCLHEPIKEQIELFKSYRSFFREKPTRPREFCTSCGIAIPFLSKIIGFSTGCFDLADVYVDDKNSFSYYDMLSSVEEIVNFKDAQLLSSLTMILLHPLNCSLETAQQEIIKIFSPPMSSAIQKYLDYFIQMGLYMHAKLEQFIPACLIATFHYKSANPNLPITKEQVARCNNQPIPEGDALEVEALLTEKETYRYYLKYYTSVTKSNNQIFLDILTSSMIPPSFWNLIRDNNRKVLKYIEYTLLHLISELSTNPNAQENCTSFIEIISDNEFSGFIDKLFGLNHALEAKEYNQIELIVQCIQKSRQRDRLAAKCRYFATVIRNSVITYNKNVLNPSLIQIVNQLNQPSVDDTPHIQETPLSDKIKVSFVPDKPILTTIERMMKDVQLLNRETTSSETFRIPKSIKEQVLFRKNWFKQNIVDSVLQMKKTKELKDFELFLFQNNLVSGKEHSDYMNNIPFKPKPTKLTDSMDRKRPANETPANESKQVNTDNYLSKRLEEGLAAIHTSSSVDEYHKSLTHIKNLLLESPSAIQEESWNSLFQCYFLQIENCYDSKRSDFYRVFKEWMEVFRCQPSTFLPEILPSDDTELISRFIGIAGYCLFQMNLEEDKDFWIASLNRELDSCVMHMASSPVLNTAMIHGLLFLFQVFHNRVSNLYGSHPNCVLLCSTLYPSQCLTSLSLLLSVYRIPSAFFASSLCYSYSSSALESVLRSLFLLSSSTHPLCRVELCQSITWDSTWIQSIQQSFSFHQLLEILVKVINSFVEQYSDVCVLQDVLTEDAWTDTIDPSWNGIFVCCPKEQISAGSSFSFTLSGKSSLPTSTSVVLCFIPDLIQLLSQLFFVGEKDIQICSSMIQFIQTKTEASSTFSSFQGYVLFLTLVCKMMDSFSFTSLSSLFEIPSSLAPLVSFPPFLLSSFLYPGFVYFLNNQAEDDWNGLGVDEKTVFIRCLPLFLQRLTSFSPQAITNSSFIWNSYQTVQYWFLNQDDCSLTEMDSAFLLNLFLSAYPAYPHRWKSHDSRVEIVDRFVPSIGYHILQYALHHLLFMEGELYSLWLDFSRIITRRHCDLVERVLDEEHSCLLAPALLVVISSADKQVLQRMFSNQTRLDCFIDYILCFYSYCNHKQMTCRCLCQESHVQIESDGMILRESYAIRRDSIVDILHLFFPNKSIVRHPLYSVLHTLFPTL